MKPVSVLIVDDSALIRQMFGEILSADAEIDVVGTASDPLEAREKIKQLNPDVITLDIEMPKMDGITFLEKIMTLRPMPVIMASTLTQKGAEATIRALELGAFDYVSKPVASQTRETIGALREELVAKVKAAARANLSHRSVARADMAAPKKAVYTPKESSSRVLIAIGASTGGVEALRDLFLRLPANSPPIVMTQHMPENFTRSFAARLDGLSDVRVAEASTHDRLKTGHAYLAPGNQHLKIVKLGGDYVCKLEDSPPVSSHKPSVDVLFHSVAEAAGAQAVGVILTGMGRDGAQGLLRMRESGARTIGQDEQSCVVYGMPKVAFQLGAVEQQMPLLSIPEMMLKYCEQIARISP